MDLFGIKDKMLQVSVKFLVLESDVWCLKSAAMCSKIGVMVFGACPSHSAY